MLHEANFGATRRSPIPSTAVTQILIYKLNAGQSIAPSTPPTFAEATALLVVQQKNIQDATNALKQTQAYISKIK